MEDEQLLADGGPIYAKTNLEQVIVEPLNAASACLFVGIVACWIFTLQGKWKSHPFF